MTKASSSHDQTVIDVLPEAFSLAGNHLATVLAEVGDKESLLAALRHIAEAQGMAVIAERTGIKRESLYRALSPKGNPTVKTLLAVMGAAGLTLSVQRQTEVH